jgi:hypothetical protein
VNRKEAIIEIVPRIARIIETAILSSEEPIMIPITTGITPNTNNSPEPLWLTLLSNELKVNCVLAVSPILCCNLRVYWFIC